MDNPKFEYTATFFDGDSKDLIGELNNFGDKGWIAVSISEGPLGFKIYLVREKN